MTESGDQERDPRTALAECREAIEALDRRIIGLLAVGKRTAALKQAAGLPILDPAREAEVIRRAAETARSHDLATEPVREIFWHIVGMSRRAQEASE
jgi:chorismate mutase